MKGQLDDTTADLKRRLEVRGRVSQEKPRVSAPRRHKLKSLGLLFRTEFNCRCCAAFWPSMSTTCSWTNCRRRRCVWQRAAHSRALCSLPCMSPRHGSCLKPLAHTKDALKASLDSIVRASPEQDVTAFTAEIGADGAPPCLEVSPEKTPASSAGPASNRAWFAGGALPPYPSFRC